MARTDDGGDAQTDVSKRDLDLLDDVLRAAQSPCPTTATNLDAGTNPQSYDEFAFKWKEPLVRLVLLRLAPLMPDDDVRRLILDGDSHTNWWTGRSLDGSRDGYAERRQRVVEWVEELHRRLAAAMPKAPEAELWLPIDEAARLAGESPARVRKGATKRKRNPIPVRGDDGEPLLILQELHERGHRGRKPAKPYRVRAADVRTWATKENAARKAARPGQSKAQPSQGRHQHVEGRHGNPQ